MGEEIIPFSLGSNKFILSKAIELPSGTIKNLPDFSKYYDDNVLEIIFKFKVGDTISNYTDLSFVPGFLIITGSSFENMLERALRIEKEIQKDCIIEKGSY